MTARELTGVAASGGVAVGRVRLLDDEVRERGTGGPEQRDRALRALADEADELGRRAAAMRAEGLEAEAEILEANRLMAEDPSLRAEVESLALEASASSALRLAADRQAGLLSSLGDPMLAARADDVRAVGRRAARRLLTASDAPADGLAILVARDLGPADVAELRESADVRGLALAEGAATSHAAIMARSLGLPMVVALGDELFAARPGETVVLDGDRGRACLSPEPAVEAWGRNTMDWLDQTRLALAAGRTRPSVTRDGRAVTLLCNAASVAEVEAGLEAGAEGVGLLRTELAFLDAEAWPDEPEHVAGLSGPLELLHGRPATVRTLDFGADKTPPFLAGTPQRGIELLLANPGPLAAQLRAILRAGRGTELRILLPLVDGPAQVHAVRSLLHEAVHAVGWLGDPPLLGAMIETPAAACRAAEIAAAADFLSVGTNDLVQYTLGLDREQPLATVRSAAEPAVLRHVAAAAAAAQAAGISIEVCGEAAGVPALAALFVGLGVDELSVAAARLDEVRATVRSLSADRAADAAAAALHAASATDALALGEELLSSELGDEAHECVDGLGGVVA